MNLKIIPQTLFVVMACFALAGLFWPRVTLSIECEVVGVALVLTSSIWRVSAAVKDGGFPIWLAGIVLAFIQPIH